jgi:hypothetical protein
MNTGNRKYKTMTEHGNIAFYVWSRGGVPNLTELRRYGRHVGTFFPETREWYKTKVQRPETWQKI